MRALQRFISNVSSLILYSVIKKPNVVHSPTCGTYDAKLLGSVARIVGLSNFTDNFWAIGSYRKLSLAISNSLNHKDCHFKFRIRVEVQKL